MTPSFPLEAPSGRTARGPSVATEGPVVNFRAPRGAKRKAKGFGTIARVLLAATLATMLPAAAPAQLRPPRPLDWDAFAPGNSLEAQLGGALLQRQRASLAGTEGRLLEAGDYDVTWRTGPVALGVAGTLLRRLDGQTRFAEPASGAAGGLAPRSDAGDLTVTTAVRLTPAAWPALVVLRFGARLPTADHVRGLDRGETDFLGLLGVGTTRGRLIGGLESGIGILGTRIPEFAQQDDWIYTARLGYRLGAFRPQATFTGQTSPLHYRRIRGDEDLREFRLGLRAGHARWLQLEWVRGLVPFSPRSGVSVAAGISAP